LQNGTTSFFGEQKAGVHNFERLVGSFEMPGNGVKDHMITAPAKGADDIL